MSQQPSGVKPARNASVWIKIFVAIHILGITMWSLPYPKKPYMLGTARFALDTSSPSAFARSFSDTITQGFLYVNWRYIKLSPLMYYPGTTGFWQFWDMFAPDPANTDLYMTADVVYKDGAIFRFHYPRVYELSLNEKYLKERYRKFFENVNLADQSYARPYVAQRIALECFKDPANPPVTVKIIANQYRIQPPGKPQLKEYTQTEIGAYAVNQAKLFQDKGISR